VSAPVDAAPGPHAEYARRLEARRALAAERERTHALTGNGRFAVAVAGLVVVFFVFALKWLHPAWLALPVVAFLALSFWHQRVGRALRRARRAAGYYERGLARLEGRWAGGGDPGTRFLDENHPNALDLDLFGKGSLFELLCTARTRSGADRLAGWLREPAAPDEVRSRQQAVEELRGRLDLREDLALLGADVPAGVDLNRLVQWGAAPPILTSRLARGVTLVLAVLGAAGLTAWAVGYGSLPFAGAAALEVAFALWMRDRVRRVVGPLEKRAHDLAVFYGVLARLEQEQFSSPRLARLRAALEGAGKAPSEQIAQLMALIELLDSRRNLYFAPFAAVLMWTTNLAFALDRWRVRTGPAIQGWLEAVAEFEALCALATYAHENPGDPFPELAEEGPLFDGEGLGHPLLPAATCVRNDVRLGGDLRVLVVSGSNMSGKSTLLRTVGVNAVLAQAGAPVRAARLRLSPLTVGATLRIQDSLQAGRSRFFAEVLRVRQLVELARGPRPLLFLLDELFHGTNSHDRRVGAGAVVRALVEAGAVGLITTHDLALTHIADQLAPRAANVHFEDHFEEGKVVFDYRMRPGIVEHSNALALMRSVGLEV
jgi:hypothetical protein